MGKQTELLRERRGADVCVGVFASVKHELSVKYFGLSVIIYEQQVKKYILELLQLENTAVTEISIR